MNFKKYYLFQLIFNELKRCFDFYLQKILVIEKGIQIKEIAFQDL